MADIFISYARADKERVAPLVAALTAQGWSIWWDPEITPGQEFDRLINEELRSAKAVIVVWTPVSVESRWVRGEARIAAERGVQVPVRFENATLPIDAMAMHTTDLDGWKGNVEHAGFQGLVRALRALVARTERDPSTAVPQAAPMARAPQMHNVLGMSAKQLVPIIAIGLTTIVVLAFLLVHRGVTPLKDVRSAETRSAADGTLAGAANKNSSTAPGSPSAPPVKPRIAVMPFENLSPDPANAFFTDGMQEEILTALSNSAPGLEVISRTTMMTYKDKPLAAAEIAKDLGATHVLEGSVRRDGDHVRVTLQLIDGKTDNHLWSKDYDRTLQDALTLQSAIASEVADQLSVTVLQAAEHAMPPTSSAEAYDLYLKAALGLDRPDMGMLATRAAFGEMDALLQHALKLDPDFALAHQLRAVVCQNLFRFNLDVSDENVRLWRTELDTAAQLAPDNPSVLASEGDYAYEIERNPGAALQFFEQVESKGLVTPHALVGKSYVLMAMGRVDDAIAMGKRIYEVDSHSLAVATAPVYSLWVAHKAPELWQILTTGPSRATPLPGMAQFYFKGETAGGGPFLPPPGPSPLGVPTIDLLEFSFDAARNSGRLADFKAMVDSVPGDSLRMGSFVVFPVPGVGRRPLAEFRGWTDLLMGDKAGAAGQSQAILDFVAKTTATRWNNWFLRILTADANLFNGDKPGAVAAAKEAMALLPCSLDAMRCLYPEILATQVLAWAGDEDAAVALLETMSLGVPGIAPAMAARDPFFTGPLANNARYKALKAKLEAQMAATKLE